MTHPFLPAGSVHESSEINILEARLRNAKEQRVRPCAGLGRSRAKGGRKKEHTASKISYGPRESCYTGISSLHRGNLYKTDSFIDIFSLLEPSFSNYSLNVRRERERGKKKKKREMILIHLLINWDKFPSFPILFGF